MKKTCVILSSIIGGALIGSAITCAVHRKSFARITNDTKGKILTLLDQIHAHVHGCGCGESGCSCTMDKGEKSGEGEAMAMDAKMSM